MDVCGRPRVRKHPNGDWVKQAMFPTCDLDAKQVGVGSGGVDEGQSIFADWCVERQHGQVDRLDWWRRGGWPRDPSDKTPDLPPINYLRAGWTGTAAGQEDIHSRGGTCKSHFCFSGEKRKKQKTKKKNTCFVCSKGPARALIQFSITFMIANVADWITATKKKKKTSSWLLYITSLDPV